MKRKVLGILMTAVMAAMLMTGCKNAEYKEAEVTFQEAMSALEDQNAELDTEISNARVLVDSEDIALDESLRPELETAISDAKKCRVDIPEMAKDLEEIKNQTKTMEDADYTEALSELSSAYDALDKSIKQYALVNNPSESYVIQCLQETEHITGIDAATEENDPNGHLGKQGGYSAQVYFSLDLIDQDEVSGDSIIDKGTACGGSIEVYTTEEDAESRNDYLAGFDGSILSNGYHVVIGTCVIRVSDELAASKQTEMVDIIEERLIRLD
ncbi:MAG: hypothetical protein K6F30_09900 [Lachnospiraceae bacterium]|nr:hypothetical protein [Lachnospiraceae bacterium]